MVQMCTVYGVQSIVYRYMNVYTIAFGHFAWLQMVFILIQYNRMTHYASQATSNANVYK